MTGQIAGPSTFSLELVGAIIGVSMIAGAVDVLRQPSWAWKRAEKNEIGNLILVLLVPLVGLGIYLRSIRPKVAPIAAAGKAASFPFEQFGNDAERRQRKHRRHRMEQRQQDDRNGSTGTPALPAGFASFSTTFEEIAGATAIIDGEAVMIEAPATSTPAAAEVSGTFFSTSSGGSARALKAARRPYPGLPPQTTHERGPAGRGTSERSLWLEGRPDRPSPIPILGWFAVDRKCRRRWQPNLGLGRLDELVGRRFVIESVPRCR